MRHFILGKNTTYATGSDLNAVAEGAVGFFYNKKGVPTVSNDGAGLEKEFMLVYGRKAEHGGPVVLPVFKNNFSYVKGEYQPATKFTTTITIPDPAKVGDYSLIVALKGTKFNERNKWTATVHITDIEKTATDLAKALEKELNNKSAGSGVTASASSANLTITAVKSGVDYAILGADELFGLTVPAGTKGFLAYGDAEYIKDLACKAAADQGIEYTYRDAYVYLYPNYPLNPLAQPDSADKGYTIFTLRFAEPRDVKTRDEVVNQIIQVAFPTGTAAITTFETVCKALAGEGAAAAAAAEI